MNINDKTMSRANVPKGIIDELKAQHHNVVFDLDSDVTENTKSYKVHYKETSDLIETAQVMDPLTFKTSEKTGYPTKCYMVRIDLTKESCIVRRVLFAGSVLLPEEYKND